MAPIASELLLRTPRFDICRATVRGRTGLPEVHHFIEKPDAVAILAVREGDLLLLEVARPVTGQKSFELPGGRIESGESPERAAVRELFEETGLSLEYLAPLGTIRPLPMVSERIHVYIGPVITSGGHNSLRLDSSEGIISAQYFSIDSIEILINTDKIGFSPDVHALILGTMWLRKQVA